MYLWALQISCPLYLHPREDGMQLLFKNTCAQAWSVFKLLLEFKGEIMSRKWSSGATIDLQLCEH